MELKNIHSRQDFNKIYEFIGGDKGGVGEKDGFANNAKLKDTMLGKLVNGMFKGISWLWRKSKEFFVINKLIAKLTNELLRGVIVYCFANNIDLQTGQRSAEEPAKETGEEPAEEPSEEPAEEPAQVPAQEEQQDDKKLEPIRIGVEKIYAGFDPANPKTEELKFAEVPIEFKSDNPIINYNDNEYNEITKNMYEFLSANVDGYDSMEPEQQERINKIYINYKIIKDYLKDKKPAQESTQETEPTQEEPAQDVKESRLNEENIINTMQKKTDSSGLVKPKLDNPEAGKVGVGKSIALKAGGAATVGDILTKRDRDKYSKEHSKDFDIDINAINLAEIEKEVDKSGDQAKVSAQVNPENLKMIELTAKELFLPSGKEGADTGSSALQLRWNKELTRVYASFTRIMNIPDVDIRGEYKNELASRVSNKVDNYKGQLSGQENAAKIIERFQDILEEGKANFSQLNGYFAFLSFYCHEEYYSAAVNHVLQITKDFKSIKPLYLLRISNTFGKMEGEELKENFVKFQKEFTAGHPTRVVYFLFIDPRLREGFDIANLIILNEDTKTKELFIFYRDSARADLIENFEKVDITSGKLDKKYLWRIKIDSLKLFKLDMVDENKKKFKFYQDYLTGKTPDFYKNATFKDKLKEIITKMKTT